MHAYSRDATIELDFGLLSSMLTQKAIEGGYISFKEHLVLKDVDTIDNQDETLIFNCEVFEYLDN